MKKNLAKQIYVYLVCLLGIAIGVGFIINGLYGIIQISKPKITLSRYDWNRYSSFEAYKNSVENYDQAGCEQPQVKKPRTTKSDKELRINWEEEKILIISGEQRDGTQKILIMIMCLVIVIPIYIVHWKMSLSLKEQE